jgi:uncharacterized protein (DUF4415 family)
MNQTHADVNLEVAKLTAQVQALHQGRNSNSVVASEPTQNQPGILTDPAVILQKLRQSQLDLQKARRHNEEQDKERAVADRQRKVHELAVNADYQQEQQMRNVRQEEVEMEPAMHSGYRTQTGIGQSHREEAPYDHRRRQGAPQSDQPPRQQEQLRLDTNNVFPNYGYGGLPPQSIRHQLQAGGGSSPMEIANHRHQPNIGAGGSHRVISERRVPRGGRSSYGSDVDYPESYGGVHGGVPFDDDRDYYSDDLREYPRHVDGGGRGAANAPPLPRHLSSYPPHGRGEASGGGGGGYSAPRRGGINGGRDAQDRAGDYNYNHHVYRY